MGRRETLPEVSAGHKLDHGRHSDARDARRDESQAPVPAQLTCPDTDTDHSDQSVPVLFAPLFLKGPHPPTEDDRTQALNLLPADRWAGRTAQRVLIAACPVATSP